MASGLVPVLNPVTTTGVDALVVVPLPSWPYPLNPQHRAVPFATNAHEWKPPALIAVVVVKPCTATGVDALIVVPLPNCPEPLAPQHLAVPSASNAQEWLPPAAIATALVRPVTTAGVVLQAAPLQVCGPVKVPLPNW